MPETRDSSDNFKIFPISFEDIEAVKKIEIETGLSNWSLEDYRSELQRTDSIAMVAGKEKFPVGFLLARLITFEVKPARKITQITEVKNNTVADVIIEAEIYNIAVSEVFQGQGAGQALFDRFLARARSRTVSKIWLEARLSNQKALGFYKKNGFMEKYRRKNFYHSPVEDAIVMCLDLRPESPSV